jgi:hypothetical protein
VLIVDGNDGQMFLVSDVAGERLEVGDDEIDFFRVDEIVQASQTFRSLADRDQIARDGAAITNAVIQIGEAKAIDFDGVEIVLQVGEAAIEKRRRGRSVLVR